MTAQVLRQKYEEDLKALQLICTHPEESDWMANSWAPGHVCGVVKLCLICEKVLDESLTSLPADHLSDTEFNDQCTGGGIDAS